MDSSLLSYVQDCSDLGDVLRLYERESGHANAAHESTFCVAGNRQAVDWVALFTFKTTSVVKETSGVPYLILTPLHVPPLLRCVLQDRASDLFKRIEIWRQDGRAWCVHKAASPGNLTQVEDLLFGSSSIQVDESAVMMALQLSLKNDQKVVGLAYTDATSNRVLGVCEFVDNDTFSNFESVIVQLGVRECILADPGANLAYDYKKIRLLLQKAGAVVTDVKKSSFSAKDLEQDLNRLLSDDIKVSALAEFELKVAMPSLAALVSHLELLSDSSNFSLYTINQYDLSQYMKLDSTALEALNLFPVSSSQSLGGKTMSLYGLLNQCKTSQGSRLLSMWIKQPLMQRSAIEERLNIVQAFVDDGSLRCTIQESHLRNFPDLSRLAKKFQKSTANLQDVVRVYQVVENLPHLITALADYSAVHHDLVQHTYVNPLKEMSTALSKLTELVQETVDLEALDSHQYLIRPEFDEELGKAKEALDEVWKSLEREARNISSDLGIDLDKKLKFEKSPIYGYHMRVTRGDAGCLRGQSRYFELSTQKAGVLFTTSAMKKLSSEHKELSEKYETLQSSVVKEIVEITASYFPILERLNQLVAHLDVLISFAHVSVHAPNAFSRPRLCDERRISLKAARHPCLEVQEDVSFIANDIEMVEGSSSFQIITGPNMGGKSTYIRQVGVIALMAQIGCYVPCKDAELSVFDSILARVGAGDSQLKGVSTFMAEMLETASILKSATTNSLIIIDELGRGTSTHDGFGLAWAIAEHIATKIKCFALFATHFHELTTLANRLPGIVKNRNVLVHTSKQGGITLLYRVEDGVCDESFGIHVAELAQFPTEVVKLAKRKVDELENADSARNWKAAKVDQENGDKFVHDLLSEFSAFPDVDQMDENQLLECMRGLQEKYHESVKANPFINEVVDSLC